MILVLNNFDRDFLFSIKNQQSRIRAIGSIAGEYFFQFFLGGGGVWFRRPLRAKINFLPRHTAQTGASVATNIFSHNAYCKGKAMLDAHILFLVPIDVCLADEYE